MSESELFKKGDRVVDTRHGVKATVLADVKGSLRGRDGYGVAVEYDDEPGVPVSTGTDHFSAIDGDNALFEFLNTARVALGESEWGAVTELIGPFGVHGVSYDMDEEGCFATIGFTLPDEFYPEIEDGTYGQLQGFRVYRDDVEG